MAKCFNLRRLRHTCGNGNSDECGYLFNGFEIGAGTMTLQEFETALRKLLDDAIKSGLPADEIQEVAEAIVDNTFLDDPDSA